MCHPFSFPCQIYCKKKKIFKLRQILALSIIPTVCRCEVFLIFTVWFPQRLPDGRPVGPLVRIICCAHPLHHEPLGVQWKHVFWGQPLQYERLHATQISSAVGRANCSETKCAVIFSCAFIADLDYVYAQCCGIFVTSTIYFAFYCAAMNNRPRIFSRAILPGNKVVIFYPSEKGCFNRFHSNHFICVWLYDCSVLVLFFYRFF